MGRQLSAEFIEKTGLVTVPQVENLKQRTRPADMSHPAGMTYQRVSDDRMKLEMNPYVDVTNGRWKKQK